MKTLSRFLASIFLCVLLVSPFQIQAQTSVKEEAYRAVLIELIQNLQKQIYLLQAELERQQFSVVGSKENVTSLSDSIEVFAVYPSEDPSDVEAIKDKGQREYFKRVFELFPDEYSEKVKMLLVFGGEDAEFDAFVETIPPDHENWQYAVHEEIIDDENSLSNAELIIHELAHIISYEEIIGEPKSTSSKCDSYFELHGCPSENSYLGQFVDEFWLASDLNRVSQVDLYNDASEEIFSYYEEHEDEFVSDYAVSGPEEDFAESFVFYVMEESLSVGSMAQDKIEFFSQYSKFVSIQKEIQSKI